MQWFAIQARPCGEDATRAVRLAVRALFPGYLSPRFCAEDSLRAVSYTRGVVRVVGAGDRAIPADDSIIAGIRARIGADGFVELRETPARGE